MHPSLSKIHRFQPAQTTWSWAPSPDRRDCSMWLTRFTWSFEVSIPEVGGGGRCYRRGAMVDDTVRDACRGAGGRRHGRDCGGHQLEGRMICTYICIFLGAPPHPMSNSLPPTESKPTTLIYIRSEALCGWGGMTWTCAVHGCTGQGSRLSVEDTDNDFVSVGGIVVHHHHHHWLLHGRFYFPRTEVS